MFIGLCINTAVLRCSVFRDVEAGTPAERLIVTSNISLDTVSFLAQLSYSRKLIKIMSVCLSVCLDVN